MIFATSIDVVLRVHFFVFQHQQRRERTHHIHRLAQPNNLVLVLHSPIRNQSINLQFRPTARQMLRLLSNPFYFHPAFPRLAVQQSRDNDRLWQVLAGSAPSHGADFFALNNRVGEIQKGGFATLRPGLCDFDIQQPWRIQQR